MFDINQSNQVQATDAATQRAQSSALVSQFLYDP